MRGLCLNIKDPFSPVSLLRTTTRGAAKPITSNSFNSASVSQCGNGNSSTGVEFMIGSSSRRTSSAFSFSVWTIVFFLSVLTINAEANPSRQEPVILEGSSKQRIRQPTWIVKPKTIHVGCRILCFEDPSRMTGSCRDGFASALIVSTERKKTMVQTEKEKAEEVRRELLPIINSTPVEELPLPHWDTEALLNEFEV